MVVHGARNEFFACACLADYEHSSIVVCDPFYHLQQPLHGLAAEDCLDAGQLQNHGFALHWDG
jgi:hypothetical protein